MDIAAEVGLRYLGIDHFPGCLPCISRRTLGIGGEGEKGYAKVELELGSAQVQVPGSVFSAPLL